LTLTPDGRELIESTPEPRDEVALMFELLDEMLCNGFENVRPEQIGALTDCYLMLSNDLEVDESTLHIAGCIVDSNPLKSICQDCLLQFGARFELERG
jgi:hypothetical protein